MEPEATQNIIHQKHPIPSSRYIHQNVSYSKCSFILLMLISLTGRLVVYLSVAIRGLSGRRLQSMLIPSVPYLPPTSLGIPFLGQMDDGFCEALWWSLSLRFLCLAHSCLCAVTSGRALCVVCDRMVPRQCKCSQYHPTFPLLKPASL